MLVSFNWLKEFVDIDESPEEIADLLTMGGTEVDSVTHVGDGLEQILTARIEGIDPHPATDKLSLARISLGDRSVVVVCGAPNIQAGQIVPYAGPGVSLPSGMEISERTIKGVPSPGVLCSENELGLGEDASGVLVLDGDTPLGMPLTIALPCIDDWIFETSVTPNRGDCLSILGTAREFAALTGRSWKLPQMQISENPVHTTERIKIEVPDADLCPRYVARMVECVHIGPSPFEVRLKLHRLGMRAISNVVDATNLILLECGQPLHAFDYFLLKGQKIVVRRCDPGEKFVTLDETERNLPENALMIRDGERSVALAGIMGGVNSEINADTTAVLIESACFERFGTRRTAKGLGMSTEASFRFERGVDPVTTLWAADRAAYLIQKLAGGTILAGRVDVYASPITRAPVRVRRAKVNGLLGITLTLDQIGSHLGRLGIRVEECDEASDSLMATPPSWRWDLEREVDMIEEVARVHGFQNIPLSMPSYLSAPDTTTESRKRVRLIGDLMTASGYTEVVTWSFVSRDQAREFRTSGDHGELALMNPLTEDAVVMRPSLLPGLLAALKRNLSFRTQDLKLYELGKTFHPVPGEELPCEDLRLAGLAAGTRHSDLWNLPRADTVDFYDVKGALETLFDGLGAAEVTFVPSQVRFLHPGKSADVMASGEKIGFMGELSPPKTREHDLPGNVYVFEILLEPLFIRGCKETVFRPIPRYPHIERDLSIIVEEKCSGEKIKQLISRLGHDIISSVIVFDIYDGESIPEGYRSIAFRIRYQSEDRTLTDEEVQAVHAMVVDALQRELGATMRE